jgi:hypothetical protein
MLYMLCHSCYASHAVRPIVQQFASPLQPARRALDGNSFEGHLPQSWAQFAHLADLTVADNLLTGKLPASWSKMRRLETLDLAGNGIEGEHSVCL